MSSLTPDQQKFVNAIVDNLLSKLPSTKGLEVRIKENGQELSKPIIVDISVPEDKEISEENLNMILEEVKRAILRKSTTKAYFHL